MVEEEQLATDPTDILFVNDGRQTANQALRLSFDFARADAQLLTGQNQAPAQPAPDALSGDTGQPQKYQSLVREAAAADAEIRETQAELQNDKNQLQTARRSKRQELQATIAELQSELDLVQTRSKTLHDILQFVGGAGGKGAGRNLSEQLDQLQRSVPELEAANTQTAAQQANGASATTSRDNRREQPSGVLSLVEDMFDLSGKI